MPRLSYPVYILAHMADAMGCGYHRILRPMEIMARAGYSTGRCDMAVFHDERLKLMAPDVIVWQRQIDDSQIEAIKACREAVPKAFHVYEIDDVMSAIPDWSPHKDFIPFGIDERISRAVAACDAVTVTTWELAEHMRSICAPGTDIRVVPNMLAREELVRVEEIRAMKPPGRGQKPRVGWGGGYSHKGDLDIIIPAMRELHNRFEFVFVGQRPECEVPCEFHQGMPPQEYLSFLAGLGLDLIVAPLDDCLFNRCKSNLRILEAGAIGVPVIASPVTPYLEKHPSITYADSQEGWTGRLTEFLDDPDKFHRKGEELKGWVRRNYLMDDRIEERVRAWMPKGVKPFVPKLASTVHGAKVPRQNAEGAVVVCQGGKQLAKSKYSTYRNFRDAFAASENIIYVRAGTVLSDAQIERLLLVLKQGNTASVVPLSNDGGIAGFPRPGAFTPVDPTKFLGLDTLCGKLFGPVRAEVSNPAGPVMALSRRAMEACGYPDMDAADMEIALIEWGVMVAAKGFTNLALANTYVTTVTQHSQEGLSDVVNRCQLRYPIKELPPDPLAAVRQELELAYHRELYKVPMPSSNVSYAEWAALFNELGADDLAWIDNNMPEGVGIRHHTFPVARNDLVSAVEAGDEWAVFADKTTSLAAHALYTFARHIANSESPSKASDGPVLYYADHDYQQKDGTCDRHDFKPHRLDRHLLLQRDYITPVFAVHLPTLFQYNSVVLSELIFEVTLYGLVLDLIQAVGETRVAHVPRVLAHLVDKDPAAIVTAATMKTGEANLRLAGSGMKVSAHPRFPVFGELSYAKAVPEAPPKVSIIIPVGGKAEVLSPCITSLLKLTDYANYEVLAVENGEINETCHEFLTQAATSDSRLRVLRFPGTKKFNWSAINNWAAKQAEGEYLLFLNDDTRVGEAHWLKEMVGAACQPGIGAVGARLMYPHGYVQHVGVTCRGGLCGHVLRGIHGSMPGYNGLAVLSHQATAVTGACMLVSRELYDSVNGFDERLVNNFNDIAFCLELERRDKRNLVSCRAELMHTEGTSRPSPLSDPGRKMILDEARIMVENYPEPDPYWNENLSFSHSDGGIFVAGLNFDTMTWPPTPWPHRGEAWPHEIVLLVGDDGSGWVEEARKGSTVYFTLMQGYAMQIARPVLSNIPAFDIRESVTPETVLGKLGITKIVVRSILGGVQEVLPFLLKLGLPLEYRPITADAACPRTDFQTMKPDGTFADCEGGWRRGVCQNCISNSGSPFGAVSIAGWREQWRKFFERAEFSTAANEMAATAIGDIYPEAARELRAAE